MSWPAIHFRVAFLRDLGAVSVMLALAFLLGLGLNLLRDQPVPWLYVGPVEREGATDSSQLPGQLDLEAFRRFVEQDQGIVLDARPAIFHQLGHVPGAVSLPRDDFEQAYQKLNRQLGAKRDRPLAVYCASATCEDSQLVAQALRKLGHRNIAVFHGGWAAWTQAGLPEEGGS